MPNFNQLPQTDHTDADDVLPLNQNGRTVGISVATLQSSLQPQIIVPSSTLLGRTSIGSGGPEPITIGSGLSLASGVLSAAVKAGGQGFTFRGAWATNTAYNPYDVLTYAGQSYVVTSAFTSLAAFSQTGLALLAAQGAAGAPGQGFNPRGTWVPGTSYAANDVVAWSGQTYMAVVAVAAGSAFDSTNWLLWAAKGDAGAAGPQGPVGAAGPQGTVGATGPTGAQGPAGNTGAVGPQGPGGATGPIGAQGPIGNTGPAGPQGLAGATGPAGAAGPKGDTGAVGPQGLLGAIGPAGAQGPVGNTGAVGPQGLAGAIGPAGAAGPKGDTGAVGPQGLVGATGPAGVQGPVGNAGAVGPQGLTGTVGPAGATGPKGDTGAVGPQGLVGATGPAGATGPVGPQGLTGVAGPQGSVGATGPTGPQGPAGPGTTIGTTAGTVAAGNDPRIVQALQPVMTVAAAPNTYNTAQRGIVISRGAYPQNGMFGWNIQASQETFTVQAEIPASDTSGSAPVAIAGYANVLTTAGGGVGVFGQGTAGADATGVFGGNFLAANYAADDVFGQTGHNLNVYGVEVDVNISPLAGGAAPAGGAFGVHISGGATIRPLGGAYAVHIDPFNGYLRNVKWTYGVFTEDGAADKGVWIGADKNTGYVNNVKPTTTNSANQGIYLNTIDSTGASHQAVVTADTSSNLLLSPGQSTAAVMMGYGTSALKTSGGNLDLPAGSATPSGSGTLGFNSTDASGVSHRASILTDTSGNMVISASGLIVANGSPVATTASVTAQIQAVVGAAPAALATLQAIDAQLSSDENAAGALTNTVTSQGTQITTLQATANGAAQKSANLSDLASVATARTNLGLASVAVSGSYADLTNKPTLLAVGTATGTARDAAAAIAAETAALQKSSNLGDLASATTARTNLGLGSAATQASSAFDPAGAAASVAASVGIFTPVRTITSGSTVNVLTTDGVIRINKTTGSATAVTLESSPVIGATHVVKDVKGDAAINNITVKAASGTIDSALSFVINTNRQSLTLIYGGDERSIV